MPVELVPIFICAILPISIVLIVSITDYFKEKQRADIIKKAIEVNTDLDTEKLIASFRKPRRSTSEILNRRLLLGCIFSLIGIGLLLLGIINLCCGLQMNEDSVSVPLVFGFISLAIGLSFLVVFFFMRKQMATNPEKSDN